MCLDVTTMPNYASFSRLYPHFCGYLTVGCKIKKQNEKPPTDQHRSTDCTLGIRGKEKKGDMVPEVIRVCEPTTHTDFTSQAGLDDLGVKRSK